MYSFSVLPCFLFLLTVTCLTEVDRYLGHYAKVAHDCLSADGGLAERLVTVTGGCVAEQVHNLGSVVTRGCIPEDDTEWHDGALASNEVAQDVVRLEVYPTCSVLRSGFILKLKKTDVLFRGRFRIHVTLYFWRGEEKVILAHELVLPLGNRAPDSEVKVVRQHLKVGVESGQGAPAGDVAVTGELHLGDDDLKPVTGSGPEWKVLRPFLPEVCRVAEPTGAGMDVACSYEVETQQES